MSKEYTVKIKLATLVMVGIGVGAFFAGYYIANYRQVGYDIGFKQGYVKGIADIYNFNSTPDKWVTIDQKFGAAIINGTQVQFIWRDVDNSTRVLSFRALQPLENTVQQGTLFLMSDALQVPEKITKATQIQTKNYYIFENQKRERYLLQPEK